MGKIKLALVLTLVLSSAAWAVVFNDLAFGTDSSSHEQNQTNCFDIISSTEYLITGDCHGLHKATFFYTTPTGSPIYSHTCGVDLPQETSYTYYHYFLPDHTCSSFPDYKREFYVYYKHSGNWNSEDMEGPDPLPDAHP